MKSLTFLDYETEKILPRPDAPPKPVGVALSYPGQHPVYRAWGHPTQNNCCIGEVKRELKYVYDNYRIVMHNAKFDLEVGEKFFGLPLVPRHGFDCTMLLSFLHNPREWSLKLKLLADKYLDMAPDEQEQLRDWIYGNIPGSRKLKTKWGELISLAPGKLVGKYAKGDIIRTKGLHKRSYKHIVGLGMLEQYEIEKRVIIKAIEMEREGIRIDHKTLKPDLEKAQRVRKRHENALRKTLGDINFNSGPQKVEAFESKGLVKKWNLTEKGNPKTGTEDLIEVCTDQKVVKHLEMFSKYNKVIGTYMELWLKSAQENKGLFFPWFNTIKGDDDKGTYTGRFSSNFQQVPREPDKKYKGFPHLRNYIIADKKSHLLFNRDYMQQELRILAHFEDGQLLSMYLQNPKMNVHHAIRDVISNLVGKTWPHSHIKSTNFLLVYGGAERALSKRLGISYQEASALILDHTEALPGVAKLKELLEIASSHREPFVTAGGRYYTSNYKQQYIDLNTLIQGSAADHAKRGLLNVDDMLKSEFPEARIMLPVHDEIMVSGPKRQRIKLMVYFKEALEYDELFDLPMLSDGKIGYSWGNMKSCD